ncbi:MAG: 4-hydroxybutyrate dehydrogenase [Proteocatella sp.]
MKMIDLKTQIYKFEDCKSFILQFNIGENDLIFTNKRVYNSFLKDVVSESKYIFKDDYNFNEPSDDIIDELLAIKSKMDVKRIVAIGGGSIIDIAKILALKDIKTTKEAFEKKDFLEKAQELIIVPTTCGTGSEVTNIAITEIKSMKTKVGIANEALYPDFAVLIPELLNSLPYKPFMYSSIDALIHAMESYVSPKSNIFTEMFSVDAIRMIIKGYREIIEKGRDYRFNIIEDFLIASNYAGIAFGNASVGAVHALSYPLGGKYHVAHGEANYQFLIEVFKFYEEKDNNPNGKLKNLKSILINALDIEKDKNVYEELECLLEKLISKNKLREYGMKEEDIKSFSETVINKQQRLLSNNYVEMKETDMVEIYSKLY